jgi:diaminopimelate decarboxylase
VELQRQGFPLEYVDLGGGLGVSYDGSEVPSPAEYVGALLGEVRRTSLPIVIEPGRAIAAPAGVLLARVIDVKPRTAASSFIIIDAGMTELLRPALYGAFHRIEPVTGPATGDHHYEVVGPVCESTDVVGRDRHLPRLAEGDLVAIRDAGAYGAVMASNYNRRPLPAEVLVDAGEWRVIRRRQTVDDQIALEA